MVAWLHASSPLLWAHAVVLMMLGVFGLHRLHLLALYLSHRERQPRRPEAPDVWPYVTVQLPVFNERFVVERLIDAACALDYPRDRLEIQVLDDSTDETLALSEACAARGRRGGLDICVLHRKDRADFKAGALREGLAVARGDFIAVFDADFVPPADFLKETIPHFGTDRVGMVQARWGHINATASALNRNQALLLDGHFIIEHAARSWSGRFFNFNGTAGVWRRRAIEEAGGWQADTLTEDLDLSYRAQLCGWDFVYRTDVVVPGELPQSMTAFKSQQYRWAKGSIETARKLLPSILGADGVSFPRRFEACCHLLANYAYPSVLLLAILLPLNVILLGGTGAVGGPVFDLPLFGMATLPFVAFYWRAGREQGLSGVGLLCRIVESLALGIGLAVNQTRAVVSASLGHRSPFVRTPKMGESGASNGALGYQLPFHWTTWLEVGLGGLQLLAVRFAVLDGRLAVVPFLLLFAVGFLGVGFRSVGEAFGQRPFHPVST